MERVSIKIEVNVDDKQLDALIAKLAALETQTKTTGNSFTNLNTNTEKLNKTVDNNSKSLTRMSGAQRRGQKDTNLLSKAVRGLGRVMAGFAKFTLKALVVNFAAALLSIGAVNAAFALGPPIIRAYKASLNVLAAAAASLVTVLAVAAAGQREYNAATQATKYGGMQNAMAQLRTINTNTQLAVLGAKSLNAAFAGISQKTQMTGGLNKALTALGDFAVASGQADKAMGAAGQFLGELAASGKLTKQIADMAAGVGPQFQKAVTEWRKKNGDATYQEFVAALNAGELSQEVAGALDYVNQTLFGAFKRNFQLIKEQFADMGQPLLPQFTEAVNRIARIMQVALLRIQANMQMFARGSLLDSLVASFEKISNWTVKTFNEDLPKAVGMIDRIRDRFAALGRTFERIGDALQPVREGGRVFREAFGPFAKAIFTEFGQGVKDLSNLFVKNRSGLIQFGESLKTLLEAIGDLFGEIKRAVVQSLPTLSKLVNVLAGLVDAISGVARAFNSLGEGGSLSLLATLASVGLIARGSAMRGGRRGKYYGGAGGLFSGWGGAAAGAAGSMWNSRAGTSGGGIGMLATIAAPLAGNYLSEKTGNSGFGTAGLLTAATLMAGAKGKLPGYSRMAPAFPARAAIGNRLAGVPATSMRAAGAYALPIIGGTIAGDYSSEYLLNRYGKNVSGTRATVGSTLAGVGTGTATGAAIGGTIAGAPGAFIGGIAGGIAGGIQGYLNAEKYKKKARQQAEQFVGDYQAAIGKALESGDALGAKKMLDQMKSQADAQRENSVQTDEFNKKYKELEAQLSDRVQPAVELYNDTLSNLSKNLGVGKHEIEEMAKSLKVNLVESVDTVKAALLGLTPDELTLEGMRGKIFDLIMEGFNKPIAIQEMQQAIDAEDIRLRQIIDELGAGAITQADIGQYVQTALSYETQFTADPFTAFRNIYQRTTGVGGDIYQPYGLFAGQGEVMAPKFEELMRQTFGGIVAGGGLTSASAALSAAGIKFGIRDESQKEIEAELNRRAREAMESPLGMKSFMDFMQSITGPEVGKDPAKTMEAFAKVLGSDRLRKLMGMEPLESALIGLTGPVNQLGMNINTLNHLLRGSPGISGPIGEASRGVPPAGMPGIPSPAKGTGMFTAPLRAIQSAIAIPSATAASPSVSYGGDTINFTIVGGTASEDKIAQAVLDKLRDRERNKKERT